MLIARGVKLKKGGVEMRYKKALNSFLKLSKFTILFFLNTVTLLLSESPSRNPAYRRRGAQYIGVHIF
jgi:hypothetical protein